MAMRSNPNGLRLNAGFLDYFRIVHGLDFWAVSDSMETKIPGLFSDSPGIVKLNFGLSMRTVLCVLRK